MEMGSKITSAGTEKGVKGEVLKRPTFDCKRGDLYVLACLALTLVASGSPAQPLNSLLLLNRRTFVDPGDTGVHDPRCSFGRTRTDLIQRDGYLVYKVTTSFVADTPFFIKSTAG